MTSPIYIALIHYPVLNRQGNVVTTSLTNLDLHDLGRISATYQVAKCFIVTPVEVQREMGFHVKKYWEAGLGSRMNPDRKKAFESMEVAPSLAETCLTIQRIHGSSPRLVATSARSFEKKITFKELRERLFSSHSPHLLLFGTGWGLASEVIDQVEEVLEPVVGRGDYNHLPVRAAVAVVLDRLLAN